MRRISTATRRMNVYSRHAMAIAIAAACWCVPFTAGAQNIKTYTQANFNEWLSKYADAKPNFKPGDVLGQKDLEKMRPFVPPGYLEQLNFPEFKMPIIAPRDHTPRKDFMNCTEKYQAQVKLGSDGTLENYLCGQPFSNASLDPKDPQSGLKAAYNFDYRWQNYGQFSLNFLYIYDHFGGNHRGVPVQIDAPPEDWLVGVQFTSKLPSDVSRDYGGGGTFEKTVSSFYERLYFSHLAPLADRGGLLDTPDAKSFFWKEFLGFVSPFDMRGGVIIDFRYADPRRADDAWTYDPKLRRVRRISVEVKSDSVAGTEQTAEDFYTFSARPLQWKWKFLGWKDVLCVADPKEDYPRFYGPNGQVTDDVWSVRRVAVIERTPTVPNHPYSSVVMLWDAENWTPWLSFSFDRDKKLYKTWTLQNRWSEDYKEFAELNHGLQVSTLQSEVVVDVQKDRATIFSGYGTGNPDISLEHANRLFDVNKLEEAHR